MTQDTPAAPPIVIAEYDPRWPAMFEEERNCILDVIGEWLVDIQHVGSTSVPGLAAKPIVDVMPGIRSLADAPRIIDPLARIGYEYVAEYEDQLPERRHFRKPPGHERQWRRDFHMHVVETTSGFWRRHLAFRDYLRANPEACDEYAALKRRLAIEYGSDREGYTEAKTGFITRIERLALGEP
jgi:GrpB-like predicted nucleotidyltransferase (UPF0157 family)